VALSALLLALTAAFVHALWNFLLARAPDPEAATAVALCVAIAAFAPVAALTWKVETAAWPYIAASGLLHFLYFALLAAAYRRAALSVVYPLARGAAPALVLLVGVAALGASTSSRQIAGVLLVAAGVLLVRGIRRPAETTGVAFGLAIAVCIAAYTLNDNAGIEHAGPIPYLELSMVAPTLAYTAGLVSFRGMPALRRAVSPAIVVAGLATFGAYALVLAALERAAAAPVAAVRETSVVIATVLAAVFLKETVTAARFAGAVLVVAGIALCA
jgi:drug/metabolite transporter (DMT)-like permease